MHPIPIIKCESGVNQLDHHNATPATYSSVLASKVSFSSLLVVELFSKLHF
ncbi:hypothetical protein QYM36_013625, partial [Artemia franciscana]